MLSTGLGITDNAHHSTAVARDLLDEILSHRNDVAHPAECDCELSGAAHPEECKFMIIETVIKNLDQHQASNAVSPKEKLVLLVLKRRREGGHVPLVTPFMGVK